MGYSYGYNEHGNLVLACDGCGKTGGVRKRRCPHKVLCSSERTESGKRYEVDYCTAPAVCAVCYALHRAKLHANCADGARRSQAEQDECQRRLDAGELMVLSACGDWHEEVPAGMVGVTFGGPRWGIAEYRLIAKDDYDPGQRRWLSDYPTARPWAPTTV